MSQLKRVIVYARRVLALLGVRQTASFVWHYLRGEPVVLLRPQGSGCALLCRPRDSDIRVLWQIFGARDCETELGEPKLILDVGANVGYSTAWFAERYPESRIVALEPDQHNFKMLQDNCSRYSNVSLFRRALWHVNTTLHVAGSKAASWAIQVSEEHSASEDSVPGCTMASLMEELGVDIVDLLKIDIEGAERQVFLEDPKVHEWLLRVRCILLEAHSASVERSIMDLMEAEGFCHGAAGEKQIFRRTIVGERV